MYNIKLVIEYDGSKFYGWQHQPELKTIQTELTRALETFLGVPLEKVTASGRTDAGVHALGQVVNFQLPFLPELRRLAFGVSSILRNEIAVLSAEQVPNDFHARKSANGKVYLYKVLNRSPMPTVDLGWVWHVPQALNVDTMRKHAEAFIGLHDFSSFRARACTALSPVKEIYSIDIEECPGGYINLRFQGSGFLKQMVRNLTGTIIDLSLGRLSEHDAKKILSSKDRTKAGQTAPACGLYLEKVIY